MCGSEFQNEVHFGIIQLVNTAQETHKDHSSFDPSKYTPDDTNTRDSLLIITQHQTNTNTRGLLTTTQLSILSSTHKINTNTWISLTTIQLSILQSTNTRSTPTPGTHYFQLSILLHTRPTPTPEAY